MIKLSDRAQAELISGLPEGETVTVRFYIEMEGG